MKKMFLKNKYKQYYIKIIQYSILKINNMKNMIGFLYKDYPTNFINYVDSLVKKNIKLTDLRLKQICKKWDIWIINDQNNGYWISGEWDTILQNKINELVSLKK